LPAWTCRSAPKLVFYSREGESGCGEAQSAMGPFYCPSDMGIYLDTSFYDELAGKLGAGGDFARVYVIAHEFGHHVQNLLGTSDKVRTAQERNPAKPTRCRSSSNFRPTAMPVSGPRSPRTGSPGTSSPA
jgi:predicted metalloprotease